jgi:hypothetical protein
MLYCADGDQLSSHDLTSDSFDYATEETSINGTFVNEHVNVQDDHYKLIREIGAASTILLKNTNKSQFSSLCVCLTVADGAPYIYPCLWTSARSRIWRFWVVMPARTRMVLTLVRTGVVTEGPLHSDGVAAVSFKYFMLLYLLSVLT